MTSANPPSLKKAFIGATLIVLFGLYTYSRPLPYRKVSREGLTMGSIVYKFTIVGNKSDGQYDALRIRVDKMLKALNQSMSTYIENSEISKFNDSEEGLVVLSAQFKKVLEASRNLHEDSNGAFDPTLGPLINLWGFGSKGKTNKRPSDIALKNVREEIGMKLLKMDGEKLIKLNKKLRLNLSAIAKGFAVDEVIRILKEDQVENALVDIGGELAAIGLGTNKKKWQVGIETPHDNAALGESLIRVVGLSDGKGLATSGDYRIFFQDEGKKYSHIIDPRTGYPVAHDLLSVSVIADSCMMADGIATALMVMGEKEGLAWVNKRKNVEALFIVKGKKGKFEEIYSSGFQKYLIKK